MSVNRLGFVLSLFILAIFSGCGENKKYEGENFMDLTGIHELKKDAMGNCLSTSKKTNGEIRYISVRVKPTDKEVANAVALYATLK